MCGFVGVISDYSSSDEQLKKALQYISYRGPDSSGIYKFEILLNTDLIN